MDVNASATTQQQVAPSRNNDSFRETSETNAITSSPAKIKSSKAKRLNTEGSEPFSVRFSRLLSRASTKSNNNNSNINNAAKEATKNEYIFLMNQQKLLFLDKNP
jgi:hypothetical protein